jgi:hypothetical protein
MRVAVVASVVWVWGEFDSDYLDLGRVWGNAVFKTGNAPTFNGVGDVVCHDNK